MTGFQSFLASRQHVSNLAAAMPFASYAPDSAGYIYEGDMFIAADGETVTLSIGNQGWHVPARLLGDLEAILYQWAVGEELLSDASREQIIATTAASCIIEWARENGRAQALSVAMIANACRVNPAVCRLQDVVDVDAFMLAELTDDESAEAVAEDAYALCRAELALTVSNLYR